MKERKIKTIERNIKETQTLFPLRSNVSLRNNINWNEIIFY